MTHDEERKANMADHQPWSRQRKLTLHEAMLLAYALGQTQPPPKVEGAEKEEEPPF